MATPSCGFVANPTSGGQDDREPDHALCATSCGCSRGWGPTATPPCCTVNALLPGAVASPMLDGLADELGLSPDDVHKRWLHDQLLVEVIPPSDVTGALIWLLSDSARHVTGHCLAVDGGALAR